MRLLLKITSTKNKLTNCFTDPPQQERFEDLTKMADELDIENYHGKEAIRKKEKDILKKWSDLLDLLNKHQTHLRNCCILVAIMREVDTITASIKELEVRTQGDASVK